MKNEKQNSIILVLSIPLAVLMIIVSSIGLLTPGFYSAETLNWQAQSTGQDMIDLFLITPALLITSIWSYRKSHAATMAWGAVVLYLTYTFTIYCFDVHFNKLFLLYCCCLGLSFYSFMFFLFTQGRGFTNAFLVDNRLIRFTAFYFIFIAVAFYTLWLMEIVPAIISNTTPASVTDTGLFTNGVHVIDLSVFLPAILITGVFLLKKKRLGFILAPVLLAFFVLMNITIGFLAVLMKSRGLGGELSVMFMMGVLTVVSMVLLVLFLKNDKN